MDILSNKWLQVEFTENGAEMQRILGLHSKHEYLWNGDPTYWDRHNPLLFPIVGKLRNGETKIKGSTYKIPKHGFISNEKFEKIKGEYYSKIIKGDFYAQEFKISENK